MKNERLRNNTLCFGMKPFKNSIQAFTLIEVLIALAIIAIALMALLKSSSQSVNLNYRVQNKMMQHWVSMQGITMIQLRLIPIYRNRDVTEVTQMIGKKWYWRAHISATPNPHIEKITIKSSSAETGPYTSPLIGFRYVPSP